MLVRDGAAIPHIALAQSTSRMDWSSLEMAVFADTAREAVALVAVPGDDALRTVRLARRGGGFAVTGDPLAGKVRWTVRRGPPPAAP
jgi:alpha-D-xyloside xylohydrolase